MRDKKPHICIVNTGGTIGMKKNDEDDVYESVPGHLQELMAGIEQLKADDMPDYTIGEPEILLDSSNMTPRDWVKIAGIIKKHYADFDGFLVLHGTDTMAYTASALSFIFEDLDKPIILTGSQMPLEKTRNDAQQNLLTSLMILGDHHKELREVYLYFDNKLFRGNRTTKVNADGFEAFASPNLPPVGTVGIEIDINFDLSLRKKRKNSPSTTLTVTDIGEPQKKVASFKLFPGLDVSYIETMLKEVDGLVLECFGAGNAPDKNEDFMEALEEATKDHVVIVAVTQPLVGSANLKLYATGKALLDIGVVSGYDMTTEAALTKLLYLFTKEDDSDRVKKLMQEDLRGELTLSGEGSKGIDALRKKLAKFRGTVIPLNRPGK